MKASSLIAGAVSISYGFAQHQQQYVLSDQSSEHSALNIAIIGAGAAGSSTAYHLSRFAEEAGISINLTVFERESYVGGRSITVNAYDDPNSPIELGASIFVKINHILVDAVQTFNLSTSSFGATSRLVDAPSLGIWDGNKFVLTLSSSGPTWWDATKLLWRYGLAPIKTMNLMKSTIGKFLKLYDDLFPFSSLTGAAALVDLLAITSIPGTDFLLSNGISADYAHDVIQASTRVNYAQNLDKFHGLETMVCMATDGAMAVEGGNWQIFDHMMSASNAALLLTTNVTSITSGKDGTFIVESTSSLIDEQVQTLESSFDAVVIAAPYAFADLHMGHGLKQPETIEYVKLHVTLFTSPYSLSPALFGLANEDTVPRTILTTLGCDDAPQSCFNDQGTAPDFFSISVLTTLENPATGASEYAYKVFSHAAPSDEWLAALLGVQPSHDGEHITWIHRKLWHSYPLETPRKSFDEIEISDGLWYTGGMESFISTMETNALMGKNVARLIIDKRRTLNSSLKPMDQLS